MYSPLDHRPLRACFDKYFCSLFYSIHFDQIMHCECECVSISKIVVILNNNMQNEKIFSFYTIQFRWSGYKFSFLEMLNINYGI